MTLLGSIRAISDSTGAEVGTTAYDAFGATRATTGVSYAFGFTGEQVDAETGFVYLRARYMDPGTGRFLSQDPIGLAGGDVNLYGYVWNTPTAYVDPSGWHGAALDPGSGKAGFGGAFIGPVLPPSVAAELAKWGLIIAVGPAYYYADDAVNLLEESCETASSVASSVWSFASDPFRGGTKNQRDQWYGHNDSNFQKWFHRDWKEPGEKVPNATKKEIEEAFEAWEQLGKPEPD